MTAAFKRMSIDWDELMRRKQQLAGMRNQEAATERRWKSGELADDRKLQTNLAESQQRANQWATIYNKTPEAFNQPGLQTGMGTRFDRAMQAGGQAAQSQIDWERRQGTDKIGLGLRGLDLEQRRQAFDEAIGTRRLDLLESQMQQKERPKLHFETVDGKEGQSVLAFDPYTGEQVGGQAAGQTDRTLDLLKGMSDEGFYKYYYDQEPEAQAEIERFLLKEDPEKYKYWFQHRLDDYKAKRQSPYSDNGILY